MPKNVRVRQKGCMQTGRRTDLGQLADDGGEGAGDAVQHVVAEGHVLAQFTLLWIESDGLEG